MDIFSDLRDRRKVNSQLLAKLKNDDWVLGKLGEHSISSRPVLHQLWQVENLERVDDFPTLYYDYKTKNGIVYTNTRVIKENAEHPLINCLGIVEIVPEDLVQSTLITTIYSWPLNTHSAMNIKPNKIQ